MDMTSRERLSRGVKSFISGAESAIDVYSKIQAMEAKKDFDRYSTDIAGDFDRFTLDLQRSNDYDNYGALWAKKKEEYIKKIGEVKNPIAQQELTQYINALDQRAQTFIKDLHFKKFSQDTYYTTIDALEKKVQNMPREYAFQEIYTNATQLYDLGIIDQQGYDKLIESMGSMAIKKEVIEKAKAAFNDALDKGALPEQAYKIADEMILNGSYDYLLDGKIISIGEEGKQQVQGLLKDFYNDTVRARKAEYDKQQEMEDARIYDLYAGGALDYKTIDDSKLDTPRKMYWRGILDQKSNLADRENDEQIQTEAGIVYSLVSMAITELNRDGNALDKGVTVRAGNFSQTFTNRKQIETFLTDNYALLSKAYGPERAADIVDKLKQAMDKPDSIKGYVYSSLDDLKKNKKLSEEEVNTYKMMFDNFYLNKAGNRPSIEEAKNWLENTVKKDIIKTTVKQIAYGQLLWQPDDDDKITSMLWGADGTDENYFKYDYADNRWINPRTKAALDSYTAAMIKEYQNITNNPVAPVFIQAIDGRPVPVILNTRTVKDRAGNSYKINETYTLVPVGTSKESRMLRRIEDPRSKEISVKIYNPNTKLWETAVKRTDMKNVWEILKAEAQEETQEFFDIELQGGF